MSDDQDLLVEFDTLRQAGPPGYWQRKPPKPQQRGRAATAGLDLGQVALGAWNSVTNLASIVHCGLPGVDFDHGRHHYRQGSDQYPRPAPPARGIPA